MMITAPSPSPWAPPSPDQRYDPATHEPRTRRRRLALALVLAMIALSVVIDRGSFLVIPVLFVLVVPFEKLFPRHRSQRLRRPGAATDISYGLSAPVLNLASVFIGAVVGIASLVWLPGLLLRPLVMMIPSYALPFVGAILFDLVIYWVHRWAHEVPILWRFHSVHHSPEHMDWVSGFRNHPFDGAILAPPFVFLLAAGFSPELTGAFAVVQIATGLFLHANVRWRWRPLHRLVITPEFHHWHHANEPDAHNSNYSVFLPLWDITFGTYFMPVDRRPSVYGISEPMPEGMSAQLRHPLRGVPGPFALVRHPRRSFRMLRRVVRQVGAGIARSTTRSTRSRASSA